MPKRIKPTFDKLNPRQKKFVMEVLQPGATAAQAVVAAGYSQTPTVIPKQANNLMSSPKVQRAISEVIEEQYPSVAEDAMNYLKEVIADPGRPDGVKMKAIEMFSKMLGWEAPKKSQHLRATIDTSKYKLPGT